MIKRMITAILIIFLYGSLGAESIWRDGNLYSPEGNINTGDILIINVSDFSRLKFDLKLNNNSTSDITSNPDMTITGFLPKVASNKSFSSRETTTFNNDSRIDLSIAVRVTEVQQNRFARVTGARTYVFNGVTSTITVTGVVDPAMVSSRTVDSSLVSDFRIQIRGRKEGLAVRKAQIGEGENASAELTEQEKQRIIIDYLEKIIREMTR